MSENFLLFVIVFSVKAKTYYGARNGLETLSQMISYDDLSDTLQIYSNARVSPFVDHATQYTGLIIETTTDLRMV